MILLQEKKLKAYYNELNFLLQEYRRVTQMVKPITANLLKPHLDHLELPAWSCWGPVCFRFESAPFIRNTSKNIYIIMI